jgi:hypothetical protein
MKRNVNGYSFADPFTGNKIVLRIFVAGGGAQSVWYKEAILELKPEENQAFYGVEQIQWRTVSRPAYFRENDFPRFVIALGLTRSPDELDAASQLLPSRIAKKPPLPPKELVRGISKDDV